MTATPRPLDRRRADLDRLGSETFDLLVVGGGIVGAGALLDATSRGMRAALVEQDDVAAGTSSRSSRLIHGGLRYLEQLRFGLVREALDERSRLLRLAPHLVRLEPLLFPIYGLPLFHRAFYGSGLMLYDLLGARRDGGWAGHLTRDEALDWTPGLRRAGLRGAVVYHDGVEDDARYTLAVARTAIEHGAAVVTRARATGLIERDGRVAGAHVRDVLSGREIDVAAGAVLDATGVWNAEPDHPLGPGASVRPSKGIHLVVPRERIKSRSGLTLRVPGRVAFLVPWPGYWLIGTTDDDYTGSPDHPSADPADVAALLDIVNRTLDVRLRREDVVGTYAGLRPLAVSAAHGSTVKASREHRVTAEPNGLVRVTGGKYTTYRVMGRDAVDAVLGRAAARARPSDTADLRLVGAADRDELDALVRSLAGDPVYGALETTRARRLVDRHGTEATAVLALGAVRGLLRPLAPDLDFLEAEVAWAAREELALGLDDVLARRTRLAQELPDRGERIAARAAEILGTELGWDEARRAREVASYLSSARREFDVPEPAAAVGTVETVPAGA